MNYRANLQDSSNDRTDNVIHGLRPPIAIKGKTPIRWSLTERMEYYQVPGVSIVIIDDGQIVWAKGFGVKKAGTTDLVTTSTLFQPLGYLNPSLQVRFIAAHPAPDYKIVPGDIPYSGDEFGGKPCSALQVPAVRVFSLIY